MVEIPHRLTSSNRRLIDRPPRTGKHRNSIVVIAMVDMHRRRQDENSLLTYQRIWKEYLVGTRSKLPPSLDGKTGLRDPLEERLREAARMTYLKGFQGLLFRQAVLFLRGCSIMPAATREGN